MQQPFLQKIVADIAIDDLLELKDHCYVFPTRRAGVYFKKYLTERFPDQPIWSPQIFSILEFMEHLSELTVLDSIQLILKLYQVYQSKEPEAQFDQFYNWGSLILKDFNDIEKYLIDAKDLFSSLKDIKEIDTVFELDEEHLVFRKLFWDVINKNAAEEDEESLKKQFIKIWEVLGLVYHDFNESLLAEGLAYEGMLQRDIVNKIKTNTLKIDFKQIVIGGFNALTKAEEKIFSYLVENQGAKMYWDADDYYLKDKKQEAGHFLRKYQAWTHPNYIWTSKTNFLQSPKNINIIGVPLKVGQAKYVGEILEESIDNQTIEIPKTALVLGDETLLFPLLYALPKNVENINITMGYPLKDSPLFDLLENVFQLYKTAIVTENQELTPINNSLFDAKKENTKKFSFYSKFILKIINNSFIKCLDKEAVEAYSAYIVRNNLRYIYSATLQRRLNKPIFKIIFQPIDNFLDLIDRFNDILVALNPANQSKDTDDVNQKADEFDVDNTEKEKINNDKFITENFVYQLLKNIKKIEETLFKYKQQVNIDTFWKLFKEVIKTTKLPFDGEPLQGIQLMGFLETRTLDFKNLFVLGINEGVLPAAKPYNSYIPFNLRKGFGMPTFLDQDAIFSYHFYHLLQRSENIYLLYNTEMGNLGAGEKSRFIQQLEHEIAAISNDKINIKSRIVTTPLRPIIAKDTLQIVKTDAIMQKLYQYTNKKLPIEYKSKKLSPTALSTYINCPIQFYLKYIAELYEIEALNEEVNSMILGNILHKTMEFLYVTTIFEKLCKADLLTSKQTIKATRHSNIVVFELEKIIKDYKVEIAENQRLKVIESLKNNLIESLDFKIEQAKGTKKANLQAQLKKNNLAQKVLFQIFDAIKLGDDEKWLAEWYEKLIQQMIIKLVSDQIKQQIEVARIESKDIDALMQQKRKIDKFLVKAFESENFTHHKEGQNLLLKKVIRRLIDKILEQDRKDAPFKIIGLEAHEYQEYVLLLKNGEELTIKANVSGSIDRIDEIIDQDGKPTVRVLDYKTGQTKFNQPNKKGINLEKYFEKYFEKQELKAGFQAYLYAYLFWKKNPDARIKVGIYSLKEMGAGIKYLRNGEIITNETFQVFENQLIALLSELFDQDISFRQSEVKDAYKWSPYKGIIGE